MDLNWSPIALSYLIEAGAYSVAFGTMLQAYHQGNRYRYFIFFSLFVGLGVVQFLLWAMASLYMNILLMELAVLVGLVLGVLFLLMADTLTREAADPVKLSAYLILAAITVYVLFSPGTLVQTTLPDGTWVLQPSGTFTVIGLIVAWMPDIVILYAAIKINQHAPPNLKKYSRLFILGFIVASFIATPLLVIPTTRVFAALIAAAALFLMTFCIARRPKLFFVYSVRALRLTVLDTDSGIQLFSHTWDSAGDVTNEDLYAGMLQGVNLILKESLKQGDVQEIKLTGATLLTYRNPQYPVACVIVATKVSRTLRDALRLFTEKFYAQFADKFASTYDDSLFSPASALIAECFAFVPEYN